MQTRWIPNMEHDLLTLSDHLNSPLFFIVVVRAAFASVLSSNVCVVFIN